MGAPMNAGGPMSEAAIPLFASNPGATITSHNGWTVLSKKKGRIKSGSLEAVREARKNAYRWMQVDAVPIKGDLISGHTLLGLLPGLRNKTFEEVKRHKPDAVL